MSVDAFEKLVGLLQDTIHVNEQNSRNSTQGNEPIYPHMIVACGIRFLAGELPKSLCDIYGMGDESLRITVNKFLKAVNACKELEIKLPETGEDFETLLNEWDNISTSEGLFQGFLGAIDGWLVRINRPKERECPNPGDYHSGHYNII